MKDNPLITLIMSIVGVTILIMSFYIWQDHFERQQRNHDVSLIASFLNQLANDEKDTLLNPELSCQELFISRQNILSAGITETTLASVAEIGVMIKESGPADLISQLSGIVDKRLEQRGCLDDHKARNLP